MRYDEQHKAASRKRILESAASRFRAEGVKGTSLPDVMQDAGMTVGGFYRHFDSKDDLFEAALDKALEDTIAMLEMSDAIPGDDSWAARTAKVYLSMPHRANREGGCALPALAADVARIDGPLRERFNEKLTRFAEAVANRLGEDKQAEAWAYIATLMGGLALSRMIDDDTLARSILHACRDGAVRSAGAAK
jgi:TetR/AcrR family transcriptional regulator, transcriptional repressor for nem operon